MYVLGQRDFLSFFQFHAWDGSDKLEEGLHDLNKDSTALSETPAMGYILRIGCDNRVGSMKEFDICGLCGGDGKGCVDCEGKTNGTAFKGMEEQLLLALKTNAT